MGNSFRTISLVMLVTGAVLKRPPVTVFGAFLLGIALLSKSVSYLSLGEIAYKRKLSSHTAFTGDSVDLIVTVENMKPLPVPLTCDDEMPKSLEVQSEPASTGRQLGRSDLRNRFFLGGFETVSRRFTLNCPERGIYDLGPVRLQSGDPFGLYPVSRQVQQTDRLTVYPRVLPVEEPPHRTLYPFGTARVPSWIYHDPSMLKMVREYTVGDSRRHVDWKATARSGKLQTRVFDATFGNRVVICLDVATSRAPWEGIDREVFESLVVAAASVAHYFVARKFPVGLTSNGVTQGKEGSHLAQCPPAAGDSHLAGILSQLAGLNYYVFGSALAACQRSYVTAGGSFPLVITALVDETTLALVESLRTSAPRVAVISIDSDKRHLPRDRDLMRALSLMSGVTAMTGRLEGGWAVAESLSLSPLD
ncbi:MAG: DUF58 domain-containing protein [Bacillota bacterium]|jgi:uncharacterized protein (DUF58 family)|nr:DUF58 domain-containing protein [Candidatus Fermentithermobacillaceae bacterium]